MGVNMLHIRPILDCPPGKSDGGYAVHDFNKIDPRFGTVDDASDLAAMLRKRDMLMVLNVVVNHTFVEHE